MIRYIVQSGDTLSGIAQRYGLRDWRRQIYDLPENASFKASHPDPNLIHPGDELWLPIAGGSSGGEDRWSYKVESMDTTLGIQQRLNNAGFDAGPEDDIYGPRTTAAVRRFQQFCKDNCNGSNPRIVDSGPVDGIAGPRTKNALEKYYGV